METWRFLTRVSCGLLLLRWPFLLLFAPPCDAIQPALPLGGGCEAGLRASCPTTCLLEGGEGERSCSCIVIAAMFVSSTSHSLSHLHATAIIFPLYAPAAMDAMAMPQRCEGLC
jgi:hypothetical protein